MLLLWIEKAKCLLLSVWEKFPFLYLQAETFELCCLAQNAEVCSFSRYSGDKFRNPKQKGIYRGGSFLYKAGSRQLHLSKIMDCLK